MKKIFITLAAIATLAACSKSEVAYEQENTPIAISPVAANRTKAMVTGTEFPAENFTVWAYYKQLPAATTIADWQAATTFAQQTYIDQKAFAPRTGENAGLWGGADATYFWPKAGSLMFVGYYPTTMKNVKYSFTASENKMTVEGYTPGDYQTTGFVNTESGANHVEDFMYFNMTEASCDATTQGPDNSVKGGNHIDVVFKHALSWLSVVLKKDSATPAGATITVKKVYFTEVNTTATGTVNNSPDKSKGESNVISWATTDDETNVYVLGSETTDNTTALTEDYTCKQPVVIPQTMDGNIVVTYEIKSTDGSAFTETVTLPLSGLTTDVNSWDPAKKYTYTVTIGTSEILIDPIVDDWDDVTATIEKK